MKYNHYEDEDQKKLFTGIEEADDMAKDFYDLLAEIAENIVIQTDLFVQVDYERAILSIQVKESELTKEQRELFEFYKKATPRISILFKS